MQLILGPWTHGDRSLSHAGAVEFGPAAPVDGNIAEDFFELRRRWFDRWIKGLANGVDEEPAVRVFVMGGGSGRRNRDGRLDHGGRWRSAAEWPLPQTRWTRLYLHADRSLASVPAAGSGAIGYAFDPRDPVPTLGGAISSGEPVMHAGAFDQSAAALRSDVLVFATPPLDHELEVTGPIRVRAVDRLRRSRHGLHGETDRCQSAERGLSAGLRDEPDRGLVAGALSRQLGAAGTNGAGRGLCDHHRAVPDRQSVLPRSPPAARHIEQQFSAFRRQPELWRTGRGVAPAAHRPQPRLRRGRSPLAHPVADHSAG